jgi:hypothetical protein
MVVVWERRVRAALFRQRGVPVAPRLRAVGLVAGTQLRRWIRRAGFVAAALTALALVPLVGPALLVLDFALRAL